MTENAKDLLCVFLVVAWLMICSDMFFRIITSLLEWLIVKPIAQIVKLLFGK